MTRVLIIILLLLGLIVGSAFGAGDAYAGSLAPVGTCHSDHNASASHRQKRHAIRCLIKYARNHQGERGLAGNRKLHHATTRKTLAIARCGFSHTPCGTPFGTFARNAGFCAGASSWRLGENLATGYHTARAVMSAWLHSSEHRANLLGHWSSVGTSIRGGVWAAQFGRCGG